MPGKERPVDERLWAKVREAAADDVSPNGWTDCWIFTGSLRRHGYGQLGFGGQGGPTVSAHRLAYELVIGKIPNGLVIDHLCKRPNCVNPAHMEPVTQRENLMRGDTVAARAAAATHCPHGHPYAGANVRVNSRGHRECVTCYDRRQAERRR